MWTERGVWRDRDKSTDRQTDTRRVAAQDAALRGAHTREAAADGGEEDGSTKGARVPVLPPEEKSHLMNSTED